MSQIKHSVYINLFLFTFAILVLFSSGFIESEDAWLYTSVSRNLYYHQTYESAPNEYLTRENVNFNAIKKKDGKWYAPGTKGYSIAMVPAVIMADVYHRATGLPRSQHFPLETDWAFHLSVNFMHAVWGALLVVLLFEYLKIIGFSKQYALISALGIFFLSNLFPLSGDSFTHILFIDIFILCLILIKKFSTNSNYWYLTGFIMSYLALTQVYNYSYILLIPGLLIYCCLLNKHKFAKFKKWLLIGITLLIAVIGNWFYGARLISLLKIFHPIFVFESIWGLLFSSGKSIFLYNPLLILILLFWHKLSKEYWPEIALMGITTAFYLFFISQGVIYFQGTQVISPIWHGGLNWGTRYLSPVVAFGMILVFMIIKKLSLKQKFLVVLPIGMFAIYIQLLGVLVPYQTQYKNLPDTIAINDQLLDRYSYASHIPRFSPLITQSKELAKRIIQLPSTFDHGQYQAKFYDGFDAPYYTSDSIFRGFKHEGYLSFNYPTLSQTELAATLYYATTADSSTSATLALLLNDAKFALATVSANTEFKLNSKIAAMAGNNQLALMAQYEDNNSNDTIFIKSLQLGGENINLGSLDMPYVDYGTEQDLRRKYYGTKTNNWDLWAMRSALYENTFDLWWLRVFYYWDLPHKLVISILGFNVMTLFISGKKLINDYRKW